MTIRDGGMATAEISTRSQCIRFYDIMPNGLNIGRGRFISHQAVIGELAFVNATNGRETTPQKHTAIKQRPCNT